MRAPRTLGALLLVGLSACMCPGRRPDALEPWYPATNEHGDPVAGVFEGRVPCVEPGLVDCEKIKVALVLYRDERSHALTTYRLARVYVADSPEGRRVVVAGAAATVRGTKLDPRATVIQLDEQAPQEFRRYWAVDENILFLLDGDLGPRVGTAAWSYVLNRTAVP